MISNLRLWSTYAGGVAVATLKRWDYFAEVFDCSGVDFQFAFLTFNENQILL